MTTQAVLQEAASSELVHGKRPKASRTERRRGGKKSFTMFLCIAPLLVLVFVFSYLPLYGWIFSLYDYQPALGLKGSAFVGLQWFQMLVSSPTQMAQIVQVLANTLAMSFLGILTSFLPILFAVFLNEV
ncbi:MAG: sugar ABC transporter permease, partial [Humibacter sp.]